MYWGPVRQRRNSVLRCPQAQSFRFIFLDTASAPYQTVLCMTWRRSSKSVHCIHLSRPLFSRPPAFRRQDLLPWKPPYGVMVMLKIVSFSCVHYQLVVWCLFLCAFGTDCFPIRCRPD